MPVDLTAALEAADQLEGYERELLASLVSTRSVRAEVSRIHELCAEEVGKLGMAVEMVSPRVGELESHPEWCPPYPASAEPERMVSVLGSWGEGPGIFLFAHTDTERPDPLGDWDTDPYRATEVRDRIHGVGTADDKAGVVSVLAATKALLPRLEGVRVVVGLVHGKLGGGLGTLPTMARVGEVDTSLYCHPAETGRGMAHFKIATRGFFNFRIETMGRHPDPVEIRTPNSEDPRRGINAFTRLREVLDAVDRWADRDDLLCSVNWVSAGVNPIVLPERAVAEGTVWFRHGTVGEVYESLDSAALAAGALSTERFGVQSNPAEIPPDHPLVVATTRAIATETGTIPGVYPAHVASDIRFPIRCLSAATVGFGALGGNFYGPNEWVDAGDMHRATRAIIRIVSAWADRVSHGDSWHLPNG
ncbi:MAG: M20/M25/M40 family metallo-hydrolase [bacterium]|nr:M20/M25/M40 family metallo-hydrolase [bacterium]